jgi:signal transduction histidine kinase
MSFVRKLLSSSLRSRLLATFIAGMLASAGIVMFTALMLLNPFSDYLLEGGVRDHAKLLASEVTFDAAGQPTGVNGRKVSTWIFSEIKSEVAMRVLDAEGRVVYPKDSAARALTSDTGSFHPGGEAFTLIRDAVAMHAATATIEHEGRRWYVQLAVSDRFSLLMRRAFGHSTMRKGLAATCVLFFLIFVVTTHLTLRVALEPVRAASEAAGRITPRTLDARLNEETPPAELRPLIQSFNQLLARLEQGYRAQQDFLASAAHELKTPLALVRAQIELQPDDERRTALLKDVDFIARQVQQLLLLAEVSESQSFRIGAIDPRPAIHEVFEFMTRVADRHGVFLTVRIADDVGRWEADRGALFILLKNLIENAIQHSPSGGIVALEATARGFSIADQGPGVSADDMPRIFERFWRGTRRRHEGAGLGLTICKEIASAHGWALKAECPGVGLKVSASMA